MIKKIKKYHTSYKMWTIWNKPTKKMNIITLKTVILIN